MIDRNGNHQGSGPFFGIVLIVIGSLFLLDELGLLRFGRVFDTWWPAFVIALGIAKIAWKGNVASGGWLVFVGLWLQAIELSLFGMTYRNSWPVFLIATGAIMITQSLLGLAAGEPENRTEEQS